MQANQSKEEDSKVDGHFGYPLCPDAAPRTFKRRFDMKRHIKAAHTNMTPNKKRELTCPCCYEVLCVRVNDQNDILHGGVNERHATTTEDHDVHMRWW